MMSGGGSCRYPFTAIQWQELEHQALVFKYMASGIPVPPDLLFSIRRSLDSSFSSSFLLQQPQHTIGWNGFQVGFGRKIDPEPGRCRRTDGKKWRCSKEAYPDSKYCERHMHRGRNRSRKPVEILSTPPKSAITPPNAIPIINSPTPRKAHSFTSPNLSSRRSSIGGLQENPTSFFMDSAACSPLHGKDYRSSNGHGLKREINEHTFFAEANPISNDDSTWQLAPLTIGSSLSHMKHKPYACDFQTGQHLQSLKDYNLDIPDSHHPKKIMHHFLDESPNKDNKDSWLNSDDKMSIHNKTHLSNSVPKSMHDFFMTQK